MIRKATIAILTAVCLSAMLVLSLPQASFAGAKAGHHTGKRMQKMATALNLTDAQKTQIKPILKDARQQSKAVKQDTTLSPADRKTKMKAIREGVRSQILPILTADQKTKWAAMRHHHGKRAKAA